MEFTLQHKAAHYASLYLEREIEETKESLQCGHHLDEAKNLLKFRLNELENDFKEMKSIVAEIEKLG